MTSKLKVLLIGDNCLDIYKIGIVERLSPEAPVPVIKLIDEYTLPGMASNVKKNLENLNIDVKFITNENSITKTRYIERRSGQQLIRVDNESQLTPWTIEPVNGNFDAVVISDYDKGFLNYSNISYIINNFLCPIFLDTKKTDLLQFSANHVYIKINEIEYKNSISLPQNLIVTLGDKGALLKTKKTENFISTDPVDVLDVCGCGDTFLASLTYQYLLTRDIESSIIYANVSAGITAQHRGNYAPTIEEINHARY